MTFGLARKGEGAAIVRIFKKTFDPRLLELTPLGASGAEKYVEDTIADGGETVWFVARDTEARAFAGYRLGESGIFINYLHVDPSFHGKKIGTELFRTSLSELRRDSDVEIVLDVDVENIRAREWYERLGFVAQQVVHWQIFGLREGGADQVVLSGIAEADETHWNYGFSSFTLGINGRSFQIGRMGRGLFRSTDPRIIEYRGALYAIDPKRELLLISNQAQHGDGREVSQRARMSAAVEVALKNLRKE